MDERDEERDEGRQNGAGGDGAAEEMVEIDAAVLEAAIDAMADAGLDLDDGDEVAHHLTALLAAFLRTTQDREELDDVEVGELAADMAGAAVEIALEVDELPDFAAGAYEDDED